MCTQADALDAHPPVDSLAHVVDGERRHGDRGQRLHLDPGAAGNLAGGADPDRIRFGLRRQVDGDRGQRQGMAQGDEVGGAFGTHDPGELCHPQDVALCEAARADPRQSFRRHHHPALGRGGTLGDVLAADVDHDGIAGGVEVSEVAHAASARRRRVAAVTSGSRIRLSPTRNARAPAAAMRSRSSWV